MKTCYMMVGMMLLAATVRGNDRPSNQRIPESSNPSIEEEHQASEASLEGTHFVGKLDLTSLVPQRDTFISFMYIYEDVVIFSYADDNYCRLLTEDGQTVWEDTLQKDGFAYVNQWPTGEAIDLGVYQVIADKKFTALSGNVVYNSSNWHAVDRDGRPIGTYFLTATHTDRPAVIFSYQDNIHVLVRNLRNTSILWEGDLDSVRYYLLEIPSDDTLPVISIKASKPVSVMASCGVMDTYIPTFSGSYTGQDFIMGGCGTHVINIIPWEDNTTVTVVNLDDPADTIWTKTLEDRGILETRFLAGSKGTLLAVYVHADKDISICQVPYLSNGETSFAEYLIRGIDRDGLGLGTEFYVPMVRSKAPTMSEWFSKLHVFSNNENTHVRVKRISKYTGEETQVWAGYLDRGEYFEYSTPSNGIIHVTSTNKVAVQACCGFDDTNPFYGDFYSVGADFMPVWGDFDDSIIVRPDTIGEGLPRDTLTYELEVLNFTYDDDVIDIITTTAQPGWFHEVTDSLGNPLADTDADEMPDVGLLPATVGQTRLRVRVGIPEGTTAGTEDTFTIYGISSNSFNLYDSALVRTRVLKQGLIFVNPDQTQDVSPDAPSALYLLEVLNESNSDEIGEITWDGDWPLRVFDSGGEDELADCNYNDVPDVGKVEAFGGICSLYVEVEVPEDIDPASGQLDTLRGPRTAADTTMVWVHAASDGIVSDSATLVTSFIPGLSVHNFPNPFDTETRIVWSQPDEGEVTIRLADRSGRQVATIYQAACDAGLHTYLWQARSASGSALAPGVYVLILNYNPQEGPARRTTAKLLCTGRQ
ncbi:hypothetical protein JXM67_12605 [candidate division WOR-3 bacterium]|nr:hypothetical protein [candidate division WOR-3 bacterium]